MNYNQLIDETLQQFGLSAGDAAIITLNFEMRRVIVLTRGYQKFSAPFADAPRPARPRRARAIKETK